MPSLSTTKRQLYFLRSRDKRLEEMNHALVAVEKNTRIATENRYMQIYCAIYSHLCNVKG